MSKMVAKITRLNAMQEAAQIVKRYELVQAGIQRWICEACGMVHTGSTPTTCDSCGTSAFVQEGKTNSEIGTRW